MSISAKSSDIFGIFSDTHTRNFQSYQPTKEHPINDDCESNITDSQIQKISL